MVKNNSEQTSVSVPIGVVAAVAGLALASVAYVLIGKPEQHKAAPKKVASSGKGMLKKAGMLALVAAIENDAARKVLVTVLKVMARRA